MSLSCDAIAPVREQVGNRRASRCFSMGSLPQEVSGWNSGVEHQRRHTLTDLDGEIYLKTESGLETPPTADVNGDGVVNIQDLVIVANAFGK